MSVNKVILVGNVGRDPEIRATENGTKYARFSLATNEVFQDKQGQRQTRTEWHRVLVWGRQAEFIEQYVHAGKLLYVEGRLRTSSYEKDGQKHTSVEVVSERFKFLGPPSEQRPAQGAASTATAVESTASEAMPEPDDLPF